MGPLRASSSARSRIRRVRVLASDHARTMPATELVSVMAMADRPRVAARSMYSSGWEAPVRKVKLEVIDSSANMPSFMFFFCSFSSDSSHSREMPGGAVALAYLEREEDQEMGSGTWHGQPGQDMGARQAVMDVEA